MPQLTDDERLWLFLTRESYQQRGEGFREDWTFHLWAAKNELGAPVAPSLPGSQAIRVGGKSYILQPFANDVLYYQFPLFRQVRSLTTTLGGTIPSPGNLGYELLNHAFHRGIMFSAAQPAGRSDLNQGWTFHRVAVAQRLGPAISPNYTILNRGVALQVFPGDTLFSRTPPFADAERLSQIGSDDPLYEPLWAETYAISGATFDPRSKFHELAAELRLGAPLSAIFRATFEGMPVNVQVFGRDTLYAFLGGEILRLSDLPKPAFVSEFELEAPIVLPEGNNIPGTELTSFWLRDHPGAPEPIRRLITLALSALGTDANTLPRLTATQRRQMQGDPDIVCADLISMCWKEAGLSTDWVATNPAGTIFREDRAANFFRPESDHPFLRELASDEDLLPGDAIVYRDERFQSPAAWRAGEYHHVVIYVGPFAGTDATGRDLDARRDYSVVSASIFSPSIDAFDLARALNPRTFSYNEVTVVRHRQLEELF